jgi:hypothetical protein
LSDFRIWLVEQSRAKNGDNLLAMEEKVEPRLGSERLLQQIKKYNRLKNVKLVAEHFKLFGGKKIKEENNFIFLEVNSIIFKLPKEYVKKR